ncbi:MAG: recombinase family protein, partial [bacterium]
MIKIGQLSNLKEKKMVKSYYLVYARKSSESEDHQLASIDNQLEVLQGVIKSKKLPILETFKESHSAKAPGRPAFNKMVDLIEKRNDIKGIVCWKLN